MIARRVLRPALRGLAASWLTLLLLVIAWRAADALAVGVTGCAVAQSCPRPLDREVDR